MWRIYRRIWQVAAAASADRLAFGQDPGGASEILLAVAPGAHALVLLDQAGWHVSKKLPLPDNITLLSLPPKSPELNPVENI